MNDHFTERNAEHTRQGEKGRPVLTVLLASLLIVAGAFVGLGLLQSQDMLPSFSSLELTSSFTQDG